MAGNLIVRLKSQSLSWKFWTILIVLLICLPFGALFIELFQPLSDDLFERLVSKQLLELSLNTVFLTVGVGLLTLLLGVTSAWCVSFFDFPGRKYFEWLLLIPLAIPPYIAAITYSGIFDYVGPIQSYLRNTFGEKISNALYLDIMNIWMLMFILSMVLYPYVYMLTRASFLRQSGSVLEVARLSGKSMASNFFKIILPLSRPAIAGAVGLVIMEVLNDYGAMKYFGVSTYATAICKLWTSSYNLTAAARLSVGLVFFVLLFILLEWVFRGRKKFDDSASKYKPITRTKLIGMNKTLAFIACAIPLLFGFIFPVLQLFSWAYKSVTSFFSPESWTMIWNSFKLSASSTLIIVLGAIIVVYSARLNKDRFSATLSKLAVFGYAVPGTIIAIGLLIVMSGINNFIVNSEIFPSYDPGEWLMIWLVVGLMLGYLIRFIAVSSNSISSGFLKVSKNIDEVSRSLGASPLKTLILIDFPILKASILGAAILVFVEMLKELPITIVLRPFNFDTLATKSFELAINEQIVESAIPSLLIIMMGLIPIFLLNRVISKNK